MGAVLNHCTLVVLMNRLHQSLTWPLAIYKDIRFKEQENTGVSYYCIRRSR